MTAAVSRRRGARRRSIQTRRPVPPARRIGFRLLIRTMIRHASHPGAVMAVSFGMHGAATGGCLMTSASLPLPLAAGVPRAASHAINLAPIAPPANKNLRAAAGTQEHSAGHIVITCGQTCSTHASIMLRVSWCRQYRDLRQFLSARPEGILTTTGFRGCPSGHRLNFARHGARVKTDQQTRPWQHRPRSGRQVLLTLATLKADRSADVAVYTRILTAIDSQICRRVMPTREPIPPHPLPPPAFSRAIQIAPPD
jgi:hypothetical protein